MTATLGRPASSAAPTGCATITSRDVLRVNGRAELVVERALLEPLAMEGKLPQIAVLVHVEQAHLAGQPLLG